MGLKDDYAQGWGRVGIVEWQTPLPPIVKDLCGFVAKST
jgi:hypothetical protein